jgi:cation transport ATPase
MVKHITESESSPEHGASHAASSRTEEAEAQLWRREDSSDDDSWNHIARGETPLQRVDRQYGELLQEVRVAQTGVQFLLAFLLTVVFTPRFLELTASQKMIYVITLVLGAAATALLMAPVPFHRIVFRRRLKRELVTTASLLTLGGLTLLVLTISSALLLIFDVVLGFRYAIWLTLGIVVWFGLWWYAVPLWQVLRRR